MHRHFITACSSTLPLLLGVNLPFVKRGERWLKCPVDQSLQSKHSPPVPLWTGLLQQCSGDPSLWVCSDSLKHDASPVAPCGQTEHTRPLWHLCVPAAWRESFSCSTASTDHNGASTPNRWEAGTCYVWLYCESGSPAHSDLSGFHLGKQPGSTVLDLLYRNKNIL